MMVIFLREMPRRSNGNHQLSELRGPSLVRGLDPMPKLREALRAGRGRVDNEGPRRGDMGVGPEASAGRRLGGSWLRPCRPGRGSGNGIRLQLWPMFTRCSRRADRNDHWLA